MKKITFLVPIVLCCLAACNKSSAPAGPPTVSAPPPAPKSDAVQAKLKEYAGSDAADCGRLDVQASEAQFKTASDCAMQASQGKKPFYVAYDMPGMSVGVAGSSDGKLLTVQSQGEGANAALTSGVCPSQLRVASSGRVTCFAPGDMGSMGSGHSGGAISPGMANPHAGGAKPAGHP